LRRELVEDRGATRVDEDEDDDDDDDDEDDDEIDGMERVAAIGVVEAAAVVALLPDAAEGVPNKLIESLER
jgi:hypothetical protein